jgi:ferredoxin-type protein NapF
MSFASFIVSKCIEFFLCEDSGPHRQRRPPLRPPWSADPDSFRTRCTSCGTCAAACPNQIVALDQRGLPTIDFSKGSCTFCGGCARSCLTGALRFDPARRPWDVQAAVDATCLLANRVLCHSCGDCCEKKAIVFSPAELRPPEILPDRCDGCGACGRVCPAGAIFFASRTEAAQ